MAENAAQKKKRDTRLGKHVLFFIGSSMITALLLFFCGSAIAYAAPSITVDMGTGTASDTTGVLDLMILFAILALLPSILMMMTSFTRIVIVLSFLRTALGTQQSPPNQVLIGIALFLTLFVMTPVIKDINTIAYEPYKAGVIDRDTAVEQGIVPLKKFMIRQTKEKEFNLFLSIAGDETLQPGDGEDLDKLTQLGLEIIVPAFVASELKRAFTMGFLLFIPFLIIDMVVSSTLMSMGMVMLPPSLIALPFKIMMFVLVDGWDLLFGVLVQGFR